MIKPKTSSTGGPARGGLIEVSPGAAKAKPSTSPHDPFKYWMTYYKPNADKSKDHNDSPDKVYESVALLNRARQYVEVQALLTAYLTQRNANARTWMYEALAMAINLNKGLASDARRSLGYAADMALKSGEPTSMVSVADVMLVHKWYDRAGNLLDAASAVVPHRGEPYLMMMQLAIQTLDPKRMGDAADGLLALGWPAIDDQVRTNVRKQVDTLCKRLHEVNREKEADDLLARIPESEARDLYVRLTWGGYGDLDLVVDDPLGGRAEFRTPRTVFGGALIKNGKSHEAEEIYVCPRGFSGDYKIHIARILEDEKKPIRAATLDVILHEGTDHEQKKTYTIRPADFDKTIVVHLSDGRRKQVLPATAAYSRTDEIEFATQYLRLTTVLKSRAAPPAAGAANEPKPKPKSATQPKSRGFQIKP